MHILHEKEQKEKKKKMQRDQSSSAKPRLHINPDWTRTHVHVYVLAALLHRLDHLHSFSAPRRQKYPLSDGSAIRKRSKST